MGDFFYFMLQSSLLILLVCVIGKAGQKSLSARARYSLWLIVLVRLLVPFFLIPVSWPGSWSIPHPYTVLQEALGGQQERSGGSSLYGMDVLSAGTFNEANAVAKAGAAVSNGANAADRADTADDAGTMQPGNAAMAGENGQDGAAQSTGREGAAFAQKADAAGDAAAEAAAAQNAGAWPAESAVSDLIPERAGHFLIAVKPPVPLLAALWLIGCMVTGSVLVVQNVRFFRNVRQNAVRVKAAEEGTSGTGKHGRELPVFYREDLESPCLAGLIRPGIYVNDKALQSPETLRMVVLHERMHDRQKEPVWNFFRNLMCVVYWFQPFVWIGALVSRRDAELACDEGVIENMNKEERKQYGMILLELAGVKKTGILEPTTAINGGKKEIAVRIRTIAKRQKTKKGVLAAVLAVLLAVGIMGCTRAEISGSGDMPNAGPKDSTAREQEAMTAGSSEAAQEAMTAGGGETIQEDAAKENGQEREEAGSAKAQQPDAGREEKIPKKEALFSAATVLGADGLQLDYRDDEILIFHDYFGLVVFQYAEKEGAKKAQKGDNTGSFVPGIIDTMDLSSIGCSATQGDFAAGVRVSKDGKQVYLHAMNAQDCYRYDRAEQALYRCGMDLWPDEETLYESPTAPEGSTDFNIYDMKEWVVGEVKVEKRLLGPGQEDMPIWTEKSGSYMRALRERFKKDKEGLVVDEGWNGGYRFDPETAEDLGGEEGRWYKLVCQVDEGGNRVENPYEQKAWFVSVDGKKQLSVRRFDELICSWKDLLIYRYDDTVYVTKDDRIDPFFSLERGKDLLSFHAQDDVLCISDETAGTMTFYDREFQVFREYRDVRLAEFSENRYCVLDLNTGLYGYLDGFGMEVIPFEYSVAQGFHNGYAVVLTGAEAEVYYEDKTVKMFNHVGGCWGVIDMTGQYVIEPTEEYSNSFDREDLGKLKQPDLVDGPVTFSEVDEKGKVKFIVREDGRVLREGWIVK